MRIYACIICFVFASSASGQLIYTIAGIVGQPGYSGDGGPGVNAQINYCWGTAIDNAGNVYIGDSKNHVIRKVSTAGVITTFAGTGVQGYSGDGGLAINAQLHSPSNPIIDNNGNIYFSDGSNYAVRKIDAAGIITTVAGNGTSGFSGDGGMATLAQLSYTQDIAFTPSGELLILDMANARVRKVNASGVITTIAGTGTHGFSGDGGPCISAQISCNGISADNAGNIYLSQSGHARIRKINPAGIISTIAGDGTHAYNGDGGPAINAQLNLPYDVSVDNAGNIFIADYANHAIRKINTSGIITTVAGTGIQGSSGDGTIATQAHIMFPVSVSVDNAGIFYISDVWQHIVRKVGGCVTPAIVITASSNNICKNSSVIFSAAFTNGGSNPAFQWKVNGIDAGVNSSSFTINTLADGDVVNCTMSNTVSCSPPVISNNIAMSVYPLPVITVSNDVFISPGSSVQLTASTNIPVQSYLWTPSSGLSNPTIPNPVATPITTATYMVEATSDKGCKGAGRVTVNLMQGLYIPTAFTPNNDGLNDIFRIPQGTPLLLKKFSIYNRWGQRIFITENINKGWDGKYKGGLVENGIYLYLIKGVFRGEEILLKGLITVIR